MSYENTRSNIVKSCRDFRNIIPFLQGVGIIPQGIIKDIQSMGLSVSLAKDLDLMGIDQYLEKRLASIPFGSRIRYTDTKKYPEPFYTMTLRAGAPKGIVCQLEKLQGCYELIKEGSHPFFPGFMVEASVGMYNLTKVLIAARADTISLLKIIAELETDTYLQKRVKLKEPRKDDETFNNWFYSIPHDVVNEYYPGSIIIHDPAKEIRKAENDIGKQLSMVEKFL